MNIYLAGPMSGLPDHNHPAFMEGAKALREIGAFVLNPAELNPADVPYRAALAVDLAWICSHAEMLVLLPGYESSKGARVEIDLALAIDIPIMLLADALAGLGSAAKFAGGDVETALRSWANRAP